VLYRKCIHMSIRKRIQQSQAFNQEMIIGQR
jgi:hypothetical protein